MIEFNIYLNYKLHITNINSSLSPTLKTNNFFIFN
jgi:hypothetical protein